MFLSEGVNCEVGYNIDFSKSLYDIAFDLETTPDLFPPAPYGKWRDAFSSFGWDYIFLGPASDGTLTVQNEIEGAIELIQKALDNPLNADTVFFLITPWPRYFSFLPESEVFGDDFNSAYFKPMEGPNDKWSNSRAKTRYWFKEVANHFPNADIRALPVGEAFLGLDLRLKESPIGEYISSDAFYAPDRVHVVQTGRYVMQMMIMSLITNKRPENISYFEGFNYEPALIDLLNENIWWAANKDLWTKRHERPEINLSFNAETRDYEVYFTDTLFMSEDGVNWSSVEDAVFSPFRQNKDSANESMMLFQSRSHSGNQ